jgi:ribosomal 30S subunit maturation factor RimM
MIAESEAKVLELEIETKKERNKPLPPDDSLEKEPRLRNQILFPDTRTVDPYDPTTYGYTELGTITGAHGVHGLLKIAAVTEFSERLCRSGVRHVKAPNRRSPRQIQLLEGRHRLGDEYLIKLAGIGDRDAANKLRGSVLFARQEERPEELEQDEYLVNDLVGLDVFLEEGYDESESSDLGGRFVGIVGGIVLAEDMCAVPGLGQDMLEIILPRGPGRTASWRDEMVLVPLVPQIVPRIDLKDRAIHITPPNGLLDLTYVREEKVRIKGFLPPARS